MLQPIPIQGPKARYRGAALWRVTADSPKRSLPDVQGGRWTCGETTSLGAYFMRPVCRAECDDPRRLAVDVGLERNGPGRYGYEGVASMARPWLSRWGGYPALVQSESVVPRSDRQGRGMVGSFGGWRSWSAWRPPVYSMPGTTDGSAVPRMQCVQDRSMEL